MSVVDNTRPPYVEFSMVPREDREATKVAGHYVAKDIPFVTVTRPGDRDSFVGEAENWLSNLVQKARDGFIPESWPSGFQAKYEAWKKGEELPLNGTPIKGWPVLGLAAQQTLIQAGYLTVEDLANAPDNQITNIGIGGVSFKMKAVAWLQASQDKGRVVERVTSLEIQLKEAVELIKKQAEELKAFHAASKRVP